MDITKTGAVAASFSVNCLRCGDGSTSEYMSYNTKTEFVRMIEQCGWRFRKAGWVCADCRKAEIPSKIARAVQRNVRAEKRELAASPFTKGRA